MRNFSFSERSQTETENRKKTMDLTDLLPDPTEIAAPWPKYRVKNRKNFRVNSAYIPTLLLFCENVFAQVIGMDISAIDMTDTGYRRRVDIA